jgi:RNA polymerase sigma factor (sigma-70 family)
MMLAAVWQSSPLRGVQHEANWWRRSTFPGSRRPHAFLGLYRAWDRVRDPDAVLGYLRTAVVNGARSVHRSRGRARLLRVRHDPPVWSAEAAVIDGEDRRAVLAAIAALPQRQREVLALKYYLDLSERDIAAIMRVSRGTVAAASSRALAARAPPSGGPMNSQLPGDLEDRVRDAYQAAGRTVQLQTLRQTTLRVTDGSARRPRRLNALIPVAAAAAVFAVIGASVALPRLLTGSASPAGKPGISASVLAHDPPFQVIVTHAATGTGLLVRTPAGQVDSARPTTGHHVGRRHRHREPADVYRGHLAPDAGQPRSARFAARGPRPRWSQPTRTPRQPRAPGPAAPARTNGCGTLPARTGRVRQPLTSPAPGHQTRGAPSPGAVRGKATQAASVVKVT